MPVPAILIAAGKQVAVAAAKQAATSTAVNAASKGSKKKNPEKKNKHTTIIVLAVILTLVAMFVSATVAVLVGLISFVSPSGAASGDEQCLMFPDQASANTFETGEGEIFEVLNPDTGESSSGNNYPTGTVVQYDKDIIFPLPNNTYTLMSRYGTITGTYEGVKEFHYGVDLGAPDGTSVHAIADGTVTKIITGDATWGNIILITHDFSGTILITGYKHVGAVDGITVGKTVVGGEQIGTIDDSPGNLMHFDVMQASDSTFLDPVGWLRKNNPTTINPEGLDVSVNVDTAVYGNITSGILGDFKVCNAPGEGGLGGGAGGAGVTNGGWGGYTNGNIPLDKLKPISFSPGNVLRDDAATSFEVMNAEYYRTFGANISITDSYRSYANQVIVKQKKGWLAAKPGTSNHGWGLAIDLGGGINKFGTPQYNWMKMNSARYGWVHPDWAEPTGSKPEPWHWEYVGRI